MAEFLTGFSNILWGAPVLILLGIVGLLYGIRTKFFQIRKMGYILKNTAGEMFKKAAVLPVTRARSLRCRPSAPRWPAVSAPQILRASRRRWSSAARALCSGCGSSPCSA